ncbi:hypothetical protein [Effusibacillus pohliae]|uniref:hypothetical protein n=1 Tax=Effusibacillus pohliae TaxID=232270 RepID=UPI00035EC5B5|nr:hypothetical protein [Effusibacillus pohliae]
MKKVLWIGLLVALVLFGGALFGLKELTYAQMPDLNDAAQTALDHSVLYQIDFVKLYTGGPKCYAFFGKDKLGRQVIVFATKDKVLGSEYQDKGLTAAKAEETARQTFGYTLIDSVTPGIMDRNSKQPFADKTSGKFLWEIYGTNKQGQKQYTYLDFYTGKELATYVLKPIR